jgi:hypothetical protein
MVDAMVARGTAPEIIALAVRTAEIASRATRHTPSQVTSQASHCDVTVTSQAVTPGAVRTARWRKKHRKNQELAKANDVANSTVTSDVTHRHTVTSQASPRSNDEVVKEERGNQEKKELLPQLVEGQKPSKRGTRLSPETKITDDDFNFAVAAGMSRERVTQAWAEFIDYWIGVPGQRGTKLNWSSTWRNRIREITGTGGKLNGHRGSRTLQDDSLSVSKAAERLQLGLRSGAVQFAPRPRLVSDESESDLRLLPPGRSA